jgi:hypothetical protein
MSCGDQWRSYSDVMQCGRWTLVTVSVWRWLCWLRRKCWLCDIIPVSCREVSWRCIETPTPSNTALLEKPTAGRLAEKLRSVKRTRNLLSCPQDPPLDCVMTNQMNPVHVFASCPSFKVHFLVVRPLTLRYSHLPSHFSLKIMCVFLISPMRATCLIISC